MVKGDRILIAWLSDFFQVIVLTTNAQYIHVGVKNITLNRQFQCTIVYGMNDANSRVEL